MRYDISTLETAAIAQSQTAGDIFFELGMMYSTGRTVPTDRVAAHKWFNLAALRGNGDAARYRQELACEMSKADVAVALKQAREWLATH